MDRLAVYVVPKPPINSSIADIQFVLGERLGRRTTFGMVDCPSIRYTYHWRVQDAEKKTENAPPVLRAAPPASVATPPIPYL